MQRKLICWGKRYPDSCVHGALLELSFKQNMHIKEDHGYWKGAYECHGLWRPSLPLHFAVNAGHATLLHIVPLFQCVPVLLNHRQAIYTYFHENGYTDNGSVVFLFCFLGSVTSFIMRCFVVAFDFGCYSVYMVIWSSLCSDDMWSKLLKYRSIKLLKSAASFVGPWPRSQFS
jgi:hypothetical protein